jgi:sigma-B regulation protein RsbU (phosphoserine phosphatase)
MFLDSARPDNDNLGSASSAPNYKLFELPADRMPVGIGERKENFKHHTIEAKPGDIIYLYTDGYADQFGGPKGKKFKYKPLNELLLAHHPLPFSEQQKQLKAVFENWKGDLEQVDDVFVIGVRV